MKLRIHLPALVMLGVSVALPAFAAGDPDKGKAAYAVCAACHGSDGGGNEALNSPPLAGLSATYLTRQLENFRSGLRGTDPNDVYGAQMRPMAMTLADDTAVADVVAYIGTLDTGSAATDKAGAATGKAAYAVCAACHGAAGEGNEALHAPALAGQPEWYIARQLRNFRSGIRGADPKDIYGRQMRPMAMTLTDDAAVDRVAAYIATLD